MSLGHGAKIVTDGLVFAYDMGSIRSWKGAPATNYVLTFPTWGGDGADQSGFTKGAVEVTEDYLKYKKFRTYLWSPGTSNNCYLQSNNDFVGGGSEVSTEWTFSVYVKRDDGAEITSLNVYMYYPTSDGAAPGIVEDAGDGWYRVSRTRTGASATITLAGFTGFSSGHKYYLSGATLTKTNFLTAPLDHNTTRSNQNSLLDWTGNTTLTSTNLLYNSDNTFSFDGTVREIESSTTTLPQSDYVTVEVVAKRTGNPNVGFMVGNGTTGSNGYWMGWDSSNFIFSVGVGTAGEQLRPGGLPVDTTHHLVGTYDGTTMRMYVDGEEFSTYSGEFTGPIDYSGVPANFKIGAINGAGQQPDRYFIGDIYIAKIYNRALSANEVKNNFNALRGRYGI